MKKCDYCAKEISYYDQYCDEECERKALEFYEFRDKFTNLFSVLCIVGVFSIPVGIFLSAFISTVGTWIVSGAFMVLGVAVFFIPLPVENMIESLKIKKAVSITRYLGAGIFAVGVIIAVLKLIFG